MSPIKALEGCKATPPPIWGDKARLGFSIHMPLADVVCPVARLTEDLRYASLTGRQHKVILNHTRLVRKPAGDNRRAIRSAQRVGTVASRPPHALLGQFVQVGSLDQPVVMSPMTERAVSPLVSQNKQDVGSLPTYANVQSPVR